MSRPSRAPSVLTSWTRTIVRALEDRRLDAAPLLAQAGLDATLLADPNARFPITATGRLWRLASEATADPAFGLFASRFVEQTTFHALGYAVMASSTLRDAFERFARYGRLVSDAAVWRPEEANGRASFRLEFVAGQPQPADEAMDAMLSLIVRTCRALGHADVNPLEVRLRRREPDRSDAWRKVFRAPVAFGAGDNCLVYASERLDARLPSANPELAHLNEEVVARHLGRLEADRTSARVHERLVERLASGEPRPADVAGDLGLSVRSLQRRLAAEGTSFKEVLAGTRRSLALAHLDDGRTTLTELTFLLGFADTSSFARAFRRWTGTSPSAYKQGRKSGRDRPRAGLARPV